MRTLSDARGDTLSKFEKFQLVNSVARQLVEIVCSVGHNEFLGKLSNNTVVLTAFHATDSVGSSESPVPVQALSPSTSASADTVDSAQVNDLLYHAVNPPMPESSVSEAPQTVVTVAEIYDTDHIVQVEDLYTNH